LQQLNIEVDVFAALTVCLIDLEVDVAVAVHEHTQEVVVLKVFVLYEKEVLDLRPAA
jgi:hypothetical protein